MIRSAASLCLSLLLALSAAELHAASVGAVPAKAEVTSGEFDAAVAAAKAEMMSRPGDALRQAKRAREIAAQASDTGPALRVATADWLIGEALTRLNRQAEAAPIIARALALTERVEPDGKLNGDLLKSSASIASLVGDVAKAMGQLQKAYAIYLELGDARSQSIVLQNIGAIYSDANDHRQALRYYDLAREAYSQDPMITLAADNNRGNSYKALEQYDEAETAYRQALKSAAAIRSPLLEARILTNIASAQYLQRKIDEAEATLREGFSFATGEAAAWTPFIWGVSAQIAQARGDDATAARRFEQTFAGQDLTKTTLLFRDFHESAYLTYSSLGQYENALRHLAAQKRLDDEARETAASANFALMNAKFDAANQELRITESRHSLRAVKQLAIGGAIAGIIIILVILAGLVATKRSRRKVDDVNAQLIHTTRHDALTGLVNRSYSRVLLGEAISSCQGNNRKCGLLLIDLDRFKQVNDTHGHAGGDRLIELVAERLAEIAGTHATPARLGGDEFALVVPPGATLLLLQEIGRQITLAIAQPFDISGSSVMIGASVGFAIYPDDGASVETLIRNADLALYQSKRQGRGRARGYEPWMAEVADNAGLLEQDLRKAIADGELTLAYQPIVHATSGEVRSREVLLRWHHPVRGTVEPALFVSVAEKAGLIDQIGTWVLREACQTATAWSDSQKVAVNVSVAQLKNRQFVETVISALAWSGLDPSRLELELTESIFLHKEANAIAVLDSLRDLGVSLTLDDFGTGYSSLSYLQRDVFSTVKIDRCFVERAVKGGKDSQSIVRAILDLARNFNMETVAEGVETETHCAIMAEMGCAYLQGFYFGQPEEGEITITGTGLHPANAA